MKRHQFKPAVVESLESLTLLSGGAAHLPAAIAPARAVAPSPRIHLAGTLGGLFNASLNASNNLQLNVIAVGPLAPAGQVTANGIAIESGLQSRHPTVNASLVITTTQGTITLAMHATLAKRGASLPPQFNYTLVSGTGAYAQSTDHGVVRLNYHVGATDATGVTSGTFSLKFVSARGR